MILMILGLVIFFAIHLLPTFPTARSRLQESLGALAYKGVFSLIALAGLILIVTGKSSADYVGIWVPPTGFQVVTKILMLPAMILLVAAYVPSNISRRVRHPMLAAVKLWALAHLLGNGDLASIILFGSFLSYAVFDMISVNRRVAPTEVPERSLTLDVLVIVIGGAAYAGIGLYHQVLFGVPIH